jgi:hypothetical protein
MVGVLTEKLVVSTGLSLLAALRIMVISSESSWTETPDFAQYHLSFNEPVSQINKASAKV